MNIVHKIYSQAELKEAFDSGRVAAEKGLHPMLNPHGFGSMQLFSKWEDGYWATKNKKGNKK